jgi:hypothetical protein
VRVDLATIRFSLSCSDSERIDTFRSLCEHLLLVLTGKQKQGGPRIPQVPERAYITRANFEFPEYGVGCSTQGVSMSG